VNFVLSWQTCPFPGNRTEGSCLPGYAQMKARPATARTMTMEMMAVVDSWAAQNAVGATG
jgi:hypothetical protein